MYTRSTGTKAVSRFGSQCVSSGGVSRLWPAVRCVSPVPCEDMYMLYATCGPFCPVRSVEIFEPGRVSRAPPVPVLLSAVRLGFTRTYGTDVGGRSSSSELLGRINAPPAPGLSGRRLTPPPSAADTLPASFATTQLRLHLSDQVERKAEATEVN